MKYQWVRTCQECGNEQVMKSPEGQRGEAWRDAKCRKCKSSALDYGREVEISELGPLSDAIKDFAKNLRQKP